MVPKIEEILKSAKAVVAITTMPAWAVPLGTYIGVHPDSPFNGAKHGIWLMWDLMSKVPLKDLYKMFKDDDETIERYQHLIDKHTIDAVLDINAGVHYYPK